MIEVTRTGATSTRRTQTKYVLISSGHHATRTRAREDNVALVSVMSLVSLTKIAGAWRRMLCEMKLLLNLMPYAELFAWYVPCSFVVPFTSSHWSETVRAGGPHLAGVVRCSS